MPDIDQLLSLLEQFPPAARFIPVQDKNPSCNGSDWQSKTLDAAEMVAAWQEGKTPATNRAFNGVGLVLSPPFVAIDHDGDSCDRLIESLSGMSLGEALPPTLTISSGKPGRYQKIYLFDGELTHRKINTETKGEQLEIRRGASKQSVIFGSHPDTDGYRVTDWAAIAPLPRWVINADNGMAESATPRSLWSVAYPRHTAQYWTMAQARGVATMRRSPLPLTRRGVNGGYSGNASPM